MTKYDVIIIGGGAAGLMCAIEAGKRGRGTLVIEKADAIGKKILISGGGRCNFTNTNNAPESYISSNPDFARSALARYTPQDFISLVESHGINYHEKKLGQLFCDGSARDIVEMLASESRAAGVEIRTDCMVEAVDGSDGFEVETSQGRFGSAALVVATGGVSLAKIGATDLGYRLAEQFGLSLVEPRPGLVPLTFAGEDREFFAGLSGASVDVVAKYGEQAFRENMLFTHRGLSGPAILQISSYWSPGKTLEVDLLPSQTPLEPLSTDDDARDLSMILSEHLPRRFAQVWSDRYTPKLPYNRYSIRQAEALLEQIHSWKLAPAGTEGLTKAEVTVGGVSTNELSSKTMEARRVPGLYFIGEVVDVTGWLGGFNFQWAWASGVAAGQAV